MIRVVITGPPSNSYFPYRIEWYGKERREFVGLSPQPLLDACRQLEQFGVMSDTVVGLFDEDQYRDTWRLRTTVGAGSKLIVAGSPPRFVEYAREPTGARTDDFEDDPSVLQHPDPQIAPTRLADLNAEHSAISEEPPPEPHRPPKRQAGKGRGHAAPSKTAQSHRKRKRAGSGGRRGSRSRH